MIEYHYWQQQLQVCCCKCRNCIHNWINLNELIRYIVILFGGRFHKLFLLGFVDCILLFENYNYIRIVWIVVILKLCLCNFRLGNKSYLLLMFFIRNSRLIPSLQNHFLCIDELLNSLNILLFVFYFHQFFLFFRKM